MQWEILVDWVVRILLFVYAVITTFVAVIKSKKSKTAQEQATTLDTSSILDVVNLTLQNMADMEQAYKAISKEGAKTGMLKETSVLNYIDNICRENNIPFDATAWKNIIANVINVKNCDESQPVQSTEQKVNGVNFEILGGNK